MKCVECGKFIKEEDFPICPKCLGKNGKNPKLQELLRTAVKIG
jgi:hypothetical protein